MAKKNIFWPKQAFLSQKKPIFRRFWSFLFFFIGGVWLYTFVIFSHAVRFCDFASFPKNPKKIASMRHLLRKWSAKRFWLWCFWCQNARNVKKFKNFCVDLELFAELIHKKVLNFVFLMRKCASSGFSSLSQVLDSKISTKTPKALGGFTISLISGTLFIEVLVVFHGHFQSYHPVMIKSIVRESENMRLCDNAAQ